MQGDQDTDFDPRTTQLSGHRLNDRYLLGDLVSSGGMGAVYEGIQLDLARRVAIKVLHPKRKDATLARARFDQEASVVAALNHPHIVSVIDYGTDPEGFPFLVMEYVEGRSLSTILKTERPLDLERALSITKQVLAALSAAHNAGLAHRDLKPGNIMISAMPAMGEFAKVIDFGIALKVHSPSRLTMDGTVIGTLAFMAPEQLRNENLDHRMDIWAVGILLYLMVTGTMPFGRASDEDFVRRVMTDAPNPMPAGLCPPAVQAAIARALSKDPMERFQTADSFLYALGGPQRLPQRTPSALASSATPTKEGIGPASAPGEKSMEATVSLRPPPRDVAATATATDVTATTAVPNESSAPAPLVAPRRRHDPTWLR